MHKYITLFFLVTFILSACNGDKTPKGIINHDKMVALLTQVHIVDGSMYSVKQEPDSLYKYGFGKYAALFHKFHTDSSQFRKSVQYYATQPTELDAMYQQILLTLKNKSDSINKIQLKGSNGLPHK